ncbi:hypothetical protein F2P81_008207 [Scophthalmus maximus]|uniref:Uncharacterized protein n=1 Tax=Scophthalmus maximus TaxID=52904 RepID=A0A6A4TCP7_SCOMX|nr:hypothetical protein F2P81_008207 [Scophthalmus maximus]
MNWKSYGVCSEQPSPGLLQSSFQDKNPARLLLLHTPFVDRIKVLGVTGPGDRWRTVKMKQIRKSPWQKETGKFLLCLLDSRQRSTSAARPRYIQQIFVQIYAECNEQMGWTDFNGANQPD